MFQAATNSPVWITINGTRGSIINKYLEIAENELFPFEPDNHDLFIIYDIDIGEINKLILGHESVSAEQGWFVKSISIHIPSKQYQSEIFKINKWINSKRMDGVPLIEIQVRKPIKVNRNVKHLQPTVSQSISTTTIISTHEYESSYTIYILTENFQSDMTKPSIFIDLITDETISTSFMRLNTESSIRENLENNVLGKFKAYGTRIEKINTIRLLIRSPDQMTYWLPRFILIIIDDTQEIFQFENFKWLHYSNRDDFETITIQIDLIDTELSNKHSNRLLQLSSEKLQLLNTLNSNIDIQQVEDQLEKIKQLYMNKTGKIVIDKRNIE